MIDLHTHILPGVDDGSPDADESLEMARLAAESQVYAMVATPHCNLPRAERPLWADEVLERTMRLAQRLRREELPVRLYAGMEIFGTADTAEKLRAGRLCTLAGSQYPLIEFPFQDYAEQATEVLRSVLELGLRPIVAHPERYRYTQDAPGLLNLWVDMGCLLQVNRGSLMGRFGPRAEALSRALVRRSMAAFVASDAHSASMRTPWLMDVWELLRKEFSFETAKCLLEENPRRVLRNREIPMEQPIWFD